MRALCLSSRTSNSASSGLAQPPPIAQSVQSDILTDDLQNTHNLLQTYFTGWWSAAPQRQSTYICTPISGANCRISCNLPRFAHELSASEIASNTLSAICTETRSSSGRHRAAPARLRSRLIRFRACARSRTSAVPRPGDRNHSAC